MPILALQQGLTRGFASAAAVVPSAPPTGWTKLIDDNFTRSAQFGPDALDGTIWKHRNYGTGAAHGGSSFWNNGQCLEATGNTLKIHTRKEGTVWKVDGFMQGVQDSNPTGYGYHPGYDQFHFRTRARFSHAIAPGVGPYFLFWPSDNGWSSEIDIMEMPGRVKNQAMCTIHWDSTGNYNLGANNEISPVITTIDLTQWNVWDCRREYFTDTDGIQKARVLVWINDVQVVTPNIWRANRWLCERMVPGYASYVAPSSASYFTLPSSETPDDSWLEVDYAYLWAPEMSTTKTLSISPVAPGTLVESTAGAGATWQTSVLSKNLSSISWATFGGPPNYPQVSSITNVPTTGSVNIQPRFTASGQFLKVWETGNLSFFRDSNTVTLTTPTAQRSLSLNPQNPGTRPAGTWSTVVNTTNISTITWVVVNPDFSWVNAGTDVATTGSVTINPNFTKTGQFVKVFPKNDTSLSANSGQVTISAAISVKGVCSKLNGMSGTTLNARLDDLVAMGVGWVRFDFTWWDIEPTKGAFNITPYETIVNACNTKGIKVLGIVCYSTPWANGNQSDKTPPTNSSDFGAFAGRLAARFKGKVPAWEIWNEPNLAPVFWTTGADPVKYTSMLASSYTAIKAADPAALVITAGLAPAPDDGSSMTYETFIKGIYAAGAKNSFDAIALHPYTYPEIPAANQYMWKNIAVVRNIMVNNGDSGKQIWLTEFGSPTTGGELTEAQQELIVATGFTERAKISYAGPLFIYEHYDSGTNPTEREDNFGLVTQDGRKKPAWTALKNAV